MLQPTAEVTARKGLDVACLRASKLQPFSPAWDAAMAAVEDCERVLWSLVVLEPAGATSADDSGTPTAF